LKKQTQFVLPPHHCRGIEKIKPIISSCVLRTAYMNLKKQSQFAVGQIDLRPYLKGSYDNISACGASKQTQFPGFLS
jgi:hypothetical protein